MVNTVFVDDTGSDDGTPFIAAWHNDINNTVYNLLGNGVVVPTSIEQLRANIGVEIGSDVQAFAANLTTLSGFGVLDEDDLASDSDSDLATQQSIKAYVDNNAIGSNRLFFAYPTTYSDTFTTNFGVDANQLDITSVPAQLLFSDLTVWRLTTTGTLPAPLAIATNYYITNVNTTSAIELSLTPHGTPIILTDNGTGTHTILPLNIYTPTTGLVSATVRIIGGGGSGSGCTTTNSAGDGGGAGGGCSRKFLAPVTLPSLTITVGAGGLGTTGDGNIGATTLFGSLFSATGGQNGSGDLQDPDTGIGGSGGMGVDGDINTEGGRGMPAIASSAGGDPKAGGSGGNALFGGGGAGVFVGSTSSLAVSGQLATSFGGGGGGAAIDGAGSASGGNGFGGIVEIVESFRIGG